MPEQRGRAVRWNSAIVLFPGTAALFGATVAWAAATVPDTSTSSTSQPPAAASASVAGRTTGAQAVTRKQLAHEVATHRKNVRHLAHRLAKLRAQAARVEASARGSVAGAPVNVSSGGGGQVAAPPPVQVQPVAPAPAPPPVNTNTGASGAP
ncbi:MAG TPA: hypothetical protein VE442_08850 [Jatrophihabitans sp.]|jgi:hypothetical protein|nr:hypothetical protein [Jatrophihabitans sp.]